MENKNISARERFLYDYNGNTEKFLGWTPRIVFAVDDHHCLDFDGYSVYDTYDEAVMAAEDMLDGLIDHLAKAGYEYIFANQL